MILRVIKKSCFFIREEVFIKEQKVPKELELDEYDDLSKHLLISENGIPIATGRLQSDGHIGRVAVRKPYRGQGLGRIIIGELISYGVSKGLNRFFLGAQISAVGFYNKLGFISFGDVFLDAGIEHIMMEYKA